MVTLFQKGAAKAGDFLSKSSDIGQRVLNSVASIDPALAANPVYMGAQTLVAGAALAGKTATALSQAKSIESVGSSLKDAYGGYNRLKAGNTESPAPGGEGLATAANSS
jgi:hypothetical protein